MDLYSILQNEKLNIKLEISSQDLAKFAEIVISKAMIKTEILAPPKENNKLLTKKEVREMCCVCEATLWHWNKTKYLVPIKIGSKVMYRQCDVKKIMEGGK